MTRKSGYRLALIKLLGGRCRHRGCKQTMDLEIHHVDGNPENSRPSNLCPYCVQHHPDRGGRPLKSCRDCGYSTRRTYLRGKHPKSQKETFLPIGYICTGCGNFEIDEPKPEAPGK